MEKEESKTGRRKHELGEGPSCSLENEAADLLRICVNNACVWWCLIKGSHFPFIYLLAITNTLSPVPIYQS